MKFFSNLLRVADHMKAFVSHRLGSEEELHLRLEQSKANLAAAQKAAAENAEALKRSECEKEALQLELEKVRRREEATGARLKDVEHEKAQLGDEIQVLRTSLSNERKQKEDL